MKITNRQNLPATIISAVSKHNYAPKEGRLSVTTLINPPQMEALRRQNWSELHEDAADRIWMLLGSAVHGVLEKVDDDNVIIEEKLELKHDGYVVPGVADLLEIIQPDGRDPLHDDGHQVTDFKITSVWSFLHGVKPEWEKQLNLYAHGYRQAGFDIVRLQIIAILRDWSKGKAKYDKDYPNSQIHVVPVRLWPAEETQSYLESRVAIHKRAIEHGTYPPCTDEERWAKPDTWAVKKPLSKRATRVFESERDAQEYMDVDKHIIEYRPGANMRCDSYCSVSHLCRQKQGMDEGIETRAEEGRR